MAMDIKLYEGDVLSIAFSNLKTRSQSQFPDPLVTIDTAFDDRVIGITFVGPRVQELKKALGVDSAVAEKAIDLYNGALERAGVKIAEGAPEIMKQAVIDELASRGSDPEHSKSTDIDLCARAAFEAQREHTTELFDIEWDDLPDDLDPDDPYYKHPMQLKRYYREEVQPTIETLWRAGRLGST